MATFSLEQHWQNLADFARYEKLAGGPDLHMALSAEMAHGLPVEEQIWRGGCYVAVYNAPYGEVLARCHQWEKARSMSQADWETWLTANWGRLSPGIHRHRKTVRRPDWMADYLYSYAQHAIGVPGLLINGDYDRIWDHFMHVRRLGRYVNLKLLEYLLRVGLPVPPLEDLRARDGWSPREMLGFLWPDEARVAERSNSAELLDLANELAARTQARLAADYGVEVSWFELQVFLCEYKQAWRGRQHPGRGGDSELKLARQAEVAWPELGQSDIWRARRALMPRWARGEDVGWDGNRNELKTVLPSHGYTWSDALYDYRATRDFAAPVRREQVAA